MPSEIIPQQTDVPAESNGHSSTSDHDLLPRPEARYRDAAGENPEAAAHLAAQEPPPQEPVPPNTQTELDGQAMGRIAGPQLDSPLSLEAATPGSNGDQPVPQETPSTSKAYVNESIVHEMNVPAESNGHQSTLEHNLIPQPEARFRENPEAAAHPAAEGPADGEPTAPTEKKSTGKKRAGRKGGKAEKSAAEEPSAAEILAALPPHKEMDIPIEKLRPTSDREPGNIDGMVRSMKKFGQIQPLAVTYDAEADLYEIRCGHRRHKGALVLQWKFLRCWVFLELTKQQAEELARASDLWTKELEVLERAKRLAEGEADNAEDEASDAAAGDDGDDWDDDDKTSDRYKGYLKRIHRLVPDPIKDRVRRTRVGRRFRPLLALTHFEPQLQLAMVKYVELTGEINAKQGVNLEAVGETLKTLGENVRKKLLSSKNTLEPGTVFQLVKQDEELRLPIAKRIAAGESVSEAIQAEAPPKAEPRTPPPPKGESSGPSKDVKPGSRPPKGKGELPSTPPPDDEREAPALDNTDSWIELAHELRLRTQELRLMFHRNRPSQERVARVAEAYDKLAAETGKLMDEWFPNTAAT